MTEIEMSLDPVDPGEAPMMAHARIEPTSMLLEYGSQAMVSASISIDGQVLGVGYMALLSSEVDLNLGRAVVLLDDGTHGDVGARAQADQTELSRPLARI